MSANMHFKNKPENKDFRKQLRKALTPAEAALWNVLKGSKLDGRKFRRQHGVGDYVLDFYCPEEKLCIELDGQDHMSLPGGTRDSERTRYLRHFGIRVVRFENDLVFKEVEWIVEIIPPTSAGKSAAKRLRRGFLRKNKNQIKMLPSLSKEGWMRDVFYPADGVVNDSTFTQP